VASIQSGFKPNTSLMLVRLINVVLSRFVSAQRVFMTFLTIWRLTATICVVPHSSPPDAAFYIFIQQIYVMNILNMLH